jgi:hypothetical protein
MSLRKLTRAINKLSVSPCVKNGGCEFFDRCENQKLMCPTFLEKYIEFGFGTRRKYNDFPTREIFELSMVEEPLKPISKITPVPDWARQISHIGRGVEQSSVNAT